MKLSLRQSHRFLHETAEILRFILKGAWMSDLIHLIAVEIFPEKKKVSLRGTPVEVLEDQ